MLVKSYDAIFIHIELHKILNGKSFDYITSIQDVKGENQCVTNTWEKFNQFLSHYCDGDLFLKVSNNFQEVFE